MGQSSGCFYSSEGFADPGAAVELEVGQELVRLNVYDVATDKRVEFANDVFRTVGGGAFHAGVVVYGQEWSFGGCLDTGSSGIFTCVPQKSPGVGRFREAVNLGSTRLSYEEVMLAIETLEQEWLGGEYDFISRNCCHFCASLLSELNAKPMPPWVMSLAGTGHALRTSAAAVHEAAHENAPLFLNGMQSGIEALQKMVNSIDVVLECTRAPGVELSSLERWQRCIALKVSPGRPEVIGISQLPDALRQLRYDTGFPQASGSDDRFFELEWEPPCLFLRKPDLGTPLTVSGALVRQPTYVLLNNSEIGICSAETTQASLVFRVDRHSTARKLQIERLWSSLAPAGGHAPCA